MAAGQLFKRIRSSPQPTAAPPVATQQVVFSCSPIAGLEAFLLEEMHKLTWLFQFEQPIGHVDLLAELSDLA
jgi:hypothetical protein